MQNSGKQTPRSAFFSTAAGQKQLQQSVSDNRVTGGRRPGEEAYQEQPQRKLQEVYCDKQIGDHPLPYHYAEFRRDIGQTTHTMVWDNDGVKFCIACAQLNSVLATCPGEANAMILKAEALIKFAEELKIKAAALTKEPVIDEGAIKDM